MISSSGCQNIYCCQSFSWQLSPGQLDHMSNILFAIYEQQQFANNGIQMNTRIA